MKYLKTYETKRATKSVNLLSKFRKFLEKKFNTTIIDIYKNKKQTNQQRWNPIYNVSITVTDMKELENYVDLYSILVEFKKETKIKISNKITYFSIDLFFNINLEQIRKLEAYFEADTMGLL